MMKVLVIPDVHCRTFWRECISKNIDKVEKIIFLGDYFDSYYGESNLEEDPIKMLEDIISLKKNDPDKYILLLGNHDSHYIWDFLPQSSRYSRIMAKDYGNIFKENLNLFNLVWVRNNCIFSHAGITKEWAEIGLKMDSILSVAKMFSKSEVDSFPANWIVSLRNVSFFRGGLSDYGSCIWADIREHINMEETKEEIIPLGEEGIYQVFGHTQLISPLITNKWACLDCKQGFIFNTLSYECESCL